MRVLLLFLAIALRASYGSAAELEDFQDYLRAQEELAERQFQEGHDNLRDMYVASISNRIADATAAGDLQRVLQLRETVQSFSTKGVEPLPPELAAEEVFARMQQTWERLETDLRRKHAEKRLSVLRAYDQALEQLQVRLTRENDIPRALAVQEERRRASEDPRVAEWRALLGTAAEESAASSSAEGLPVLTAFNAAMVFYMPFDVDEHGDARDRGRGRNNGIGRDIVWAKGGPRGGYFQFDGRNSQVRIPSSKSLQVTGDLTLAFWIRPESRDGRRNPIHKSYGAEYAVTLEENRTLTFYHGTAGGDASPYQEFRMDKPLPAGEWSHLTLVRDLAARKLTWYLNGRAIAEADSAFEAVVASDAPLLLGRGYAGAFQGGLDEVMIFNRPLGPSDVLRIYRSVGGR